MITRFYWLLIAVIFLLILIGGGYIYIVIFKGTIPIELPKTSYFEFNDLSPTSIAYDSLLKTAYVTDLKGLIKKYSVDEFNIKYIDSIGRYGNDRGQFREPCDIEVDKNNFIYILDSYLSKLTKMDNNGKVIWEVGKFGNNETNFANPLGIGLDKLGYIYIADTKNNRIVKYDLDGNFLMLFGKMGKEPSQFDNPVDVAIDTKGFIYVLDKNNNRIQVFDSNANFISYNNYSIDISKINRIYIDEKDLIYLISDTEIYIANRERILEKITPFFEKNKFTILNVFKWVNKLYILYKNDKNIGGIKIIQTKS
ncbi:MAG: NHL repeat-containing protein [bacterium]|nr:NHL repeat-containing protein [bacterium]